MGRSRSAEVLRVDGRLALEPVAIHSDEIRISLEPLVGFCIGWLLLAFPLFFGGVSPAAHAITSTLVFVTSALILVRDREQAASTLLARGTATRLAVVCIGCFLAIAATETLILWFTPFGSIHPVATPLATPNGSILNSYAAFRALREVLLFLAIFSIVRLALETSRLRQLVPGAILLSGAIVSFVCLLHWLSDNGRLFWVFAPDHEEVSPRARWPFVNPNHLADFLLPIAFVIAGAAHALVLRFVSRLGMRKVRGRRELAHAMRSKTLQSSAVQAVAACLGALAVLLCIVASLSRSAWIGLLVGGAICILLSSAGGRRERGTALAVFAAIGVLVLLLLRGRGGELVAGRIEYGIAHSRDDVRWMLYGATLRMLEGNWILGLGLGNWSELLPLYMPEALSGLVPYYLHSEPFQLVAETGLIGALPLLYLFAAIALRGLRSRANDTRFLTCGMVAFFVASLFEFPLRIPAITALTAVLLAMLCCGIDEDSQSGDFSHDERSTER